MVTTATHLEVQKINTNERPLYLNYIIDVMCSFCNMFDVYGALMSKFNIKIIVEIQFLF